MGLDVDWELEDWLLEAGEQAERKAIAAGVLSPAERLVREVWAFDVHTRNGGVSQYFAEHGRARWEALEAAWLPEAVPSLGPILAEVDRVIAGAPGPYLAALGASPGIEELYEANQPAVLREMRQLALES